MISGFSKELEGKGAACYFPQNPVSCYRVNGWHSYSLCDRVLRKLITNSQKAAIRKSHWTTKPTPFRGEVNWVATTFLKPSIKNKMLKTDLYPNTKPLESRVSGVLKLDSKGGSHHFVGR
jgi:hypothetical protein